VRRTSTLVACFAFVLSIPAFSAELPEAIDAKGALVVLETHAVGAQVYECKPNAQGARTWAFREPIATLIRDGKTIGRHYAGPTWEIEGSVVVGKPKARAPGASARDISWLKLTIAEKRGDGLLKDVTTVQRINTSGGMLEGACKTLGETIAEPYAADYRFLKD
jgi:hypothetical protein